MVLLNGLGLEVRVLVNGSLTTEYADNENDAGNDEYDQSTPRSFHYIESVSGAEFSIEVEAKPGAAGRWLESGSKRAFRFYIDIDGEDSIARGTSESSRLLDVVPGVKEFHKGCTKLRKFRFSTVHTVDDASKQRVAKDIQTAQRLGTMKIRVYQGSYRDLNRPPNSYVTTFGKNGNEIAEKALKGRAISDRSTLSPAEFLGKFDHVREYDLPGWYRAPLAIFHFKYRSKEALQQELIIPRPRSISAEPDLDDLTDGEAHRLAREYLEERRGKRKRASIKAEDGEVPRSGRPLKVLKREGGQVVIDLTEDS